MISIELRRTDGGQMPDELDIYLDNDGIQSLCKQLQFIKNGQADHVHLMSESWGGVHLSDLPQTVNGALIRHVKIHLR